MEKKESPKIEPGLELKAGAISGKVSGFSRKIFGIIKFILGICLLPFVYSSSSAFINEFAVVDKALRNCFWSGVISLLVIYLFIWEPMVIYVRGQKLLELFFNFFKPLVRVAPYLLPIYTTVLYILYWLLSLIFKSSSLAAYFIFLFGFSISLHLIFSAKSIRGKKEDFLKANYIFGFSFIYILNLFLLALLFSLIFEKFSLVNFLNNSSQLAKNIFTSVFKQLFL